MAQEIKMDPLQKQMLDDVFDAFTMLTNSAAIVSLMHVAGGYTRYTKSAVELFGLPGEYIENGAMDWNDYLHPEDRRRYMEVMGPLIDGSATTYDLSYRVRLKTGEYNIFRVVGAVLRGNDGKPSLIGGAMFNEGAAKNIDPVTALPDKNSYLDDLNERMGEGKSTLSLLTGASRFSEVNQMHGYNFGNRTLQEIAWMIQELVGERGKVYRFEGAKLAVLSETMSRQEMGALYDMIRYRMQRGIQVNGVRSALSANGGLVSTFGKNVDATTVHTFLLYAYAQSKGNHGDLVDYNGNVNYEGATYLEMVNAMRDAIMYGCEGFSVVYLPVMDAKTGKINGAEGLVRWEDERYGTLESTDIIPILERDFVFEELGEFILRKGLTDARTFSERKEGFLLCLNVYRMQLESDFFIDSLFDILDETECPAEKLSLKFDSDCRDIDGARMRRILDRLHERGITVIIDNFGGGKDSVQFLKEMPFDAVSLNQELVEGITENDRDKSLLEHLTMMAATCAKHINIKGIDSKERFDVVKDFPITTVQGDHFYTVQTFDEMSHIWAK